MAWGPEISAIIAALFTGISGVILAMTKWQADKVKDQAEEITKLEGRVAHLEEQQIKDRKLFREAIRYIRAQINHALVLSGLLRAHAPDVVIPDEPALPDELRHEI